MSENPNRMMAVIASVAKPAVTAHEPSRTRSLPAGDTDPSAGTQTTQRLDQTTSWSPPTARPSRRRSHREPPQLRLDPPIGRVGDGGVSVPRRPRFRPADVGALGYPGTVVELGEWGGGVFKAAPGCRSRSEGRPAVARSGRCRPRDRRSTRRAVAPRAVHVPPDRHPDLHPAGRARRQPCPVRRSPEARLPAGAARGGRSGQGETGPNSPSGTPPPPTLHTDGSRPASAWSPSEPPSRPTLLLRQPGAGSPTTGICSARVAWSTSTTS